MPAYFESGFAVREPMWHNQGAVLDDYPGSWAEARIHAGLDWDPQEGPVFDLVGIDGEGNPRYEPITGYKKISRSDDGALLDIANEGYHIIGHGPMGDIVEAILDQDQVRYETAGSIYGGRRVWALAVLGDDVQIGRDPSPTRRYLALLNSHDGSAAMRAIATSVRIVCANTWKQAEMDSKTSGSVYAFKHTKNWKDRAEEAKLAVLGAYRQMDAYLDDAAELAAIGCTSAQEAEFVDAFVPEPAARIVSKIVRANIDTARGDLRTILAGPTCEGIRGTAFGLVQAAGEYLDWYRKAKTEDSKLSRQLLNVEPLKLTAVKIARQVCNA